ncbi:MAG: hypothetical protein ACO3M3_00835 [Flavobacteriaceae bacterium]
MEQSKIKQLLESYLEGKTTLEEEAILRDFFTQSSQIPKELSVYKPFFTFYKYAQKEQFPRSKKQSYSRIVKLFVGIAAILALVFTLQTQQGNQAGPLTDEELAIAYEEFQTQMQRVSSHLNRGTQNITYLDYWNTTTQKITTP